MLLLIANEGERKRIEKRKTTTTKIQKTKTKKGLCTKKRKEV